LLRESKQHTVAQALENPPWVSDIKCTLSVPVLRHYLLLWDLVDNILLQEGVEDQHQWKLTRSGIYSSKSAYNAYFCGSIRFAPWKRTWKSWAPQNCNFFIWLAINNRCWTGDRLAKRGLPHPAACPLCDQAGEIHPAFVFCRSLASLLDRSGLLFFTFQRLGLSSISLVSTSKF